MASLQWRPVHLDSGHRCWVPSLGLDPDTAVSHPSIGPWRTGGLQGTLLPPSLVRAALAENGWPSLRSQLSQEGQGQVAPCPKSGPRWELDGSCWKAGAEGWG